MTTSLFDGERNLSAKYILFGKSDHLSKMDVLNKLQLTRYIMQKLRKNHALSAWLVGRKKEEKTCAPYV